MSAKTDRTPFLGVIEGFYGRPWSPQDRAHMARWLPAIGIQAYLYAPKADAYLRRSWREDWPVAWRRDLSLLADRCQSNGLIMGVGLSPFALYEDYGEAVRRRLRDKVAQLEDLGIAALALLFDDMPGATPDIARKQAEICADVAAWTQFDRLAMCPTYYSDDPVLDRVFGTRPAGYLEDLCAELPPSVDVFWTGPQVCATALSARDLAAPGRAAGRRLALWDNYPVNDSQSRAEHLYVQPLQNRDPAIREFIVSHWCNAMNQAALSLPALATLPALYGRSAPDREAALAQAGLSEALLQACEPLAETARSALPAGLSERLHEVAAGTSPAAGELRDWLAGAYTFDPACLTD